MAFSRSIVSFHSSDKRHPLISVHFRFTRKQSDAVWYFAVILPFAGETHCMHTFDGGYSFDGPFATTDLRRGAEEGQKTSHCKEDRGLLCGGGRSRGGMVHSWSRVH